MRGGALPPNTLPFLPNILVASGCVPRSFLKWGHFSVMWSPSQRSQHSFAGLSFSLRRLTDGGGGLRLSCDGILRDFLSSSITEEGSASFTLGDGFRDGSDRRRSRAVGPSP